MKIRIANLDEASPLVLDLQTGERVVIEPMMLREIDLAPNDQMLVTAPNGPVLDMPTAADMTGFIASMGARAAKMFDMAGIIASHAMQPAEFHPFNLPAFVELNYDPATRQQGKNLMDGSDVFAGPALEGKTNDAA